ncbi:MAG TPA: PspA/IM30 family protein [Chloroflexota bacterium]
MAAADPREALRQAIAYEHVLHRQAEQHAQRAARWRQRAELALRKAEDTLAREALQREAQELGRAEAYRTQLAAHSEAIRKAKTLLRAAPPPDALEILVLQDRIERDLAELKARLQSA